MLDTLKGEVTVFVHVKNEGKKSEKVNYSACIGSNQLMDKSWINFFVPVDFSKSLQDDLPVPKDGDKFEILLKMGWIKPYKDKDDVVHPTLFVNKAKIMN